MASEKKKKSNKQETQTEVPMGITPFTIDLDPLVGAHPDKKRTFIFEGSHYSNVAIVNVGQRDVHIDFLELPGFVVDDEVQVKGTRVYMPHSAAQRLAIILPQILDKVHSTGQMEAYAPPEKSKKQTGKKE